MGDFKTIGENEEILLNTQNSFSDVFWSSDRPLRRPA